MLNCKLKLNQDVFLEESEKRSPRDAFGSTLTELAGKNESIVALVADLSESVKLKDFGEKYPNRFIQTGIAEQNMCSISAGLAVEGNIPFLVSHAVF